MVAELEDQAASRRERRARFREYIFDLIRLVVIATILFFGVVEVVQLAHLPAWWQAPIAGIIATFFIVSELTWRDKFRPLELRGYSGEMLAERMAEFDIGDETSAPLTRLAVRIDFGIEGPVTMGALAPLIAALDRAIRLAANPEDPDSVSIELVEISAGSLIVKLAIAGVALQGVSLTHDIYRGIVDDRRVAEEARQLNRGCDVNLRFTADGKSFNTVLAPPRPTEDGARVTDYQRGTVTFSRSGGTTFASFDEGETDIPVSDQRLLGEIVIAGVRYEAYGRIVRASDGRAQMFELMAATRL